MRSALLVFAVVWAVGSGAQETTMVVPQGSPAFPSIGQVDCLEEVASGRLCAASWACADGSSGALWGDMGNPDGRRTSGADADIAIKRGCVVTVDGKAAVRWFSGFRPAGRTGPLVGVTAAPGAMRPVVRTSVVGGASDGLLLDWLIDEHGYDVQDMLDRECGHIRDEATEHRRECERRIRRRIGSFVGYASTEYTRCAAERFIEQERETIHEELPELQVLDTLLGWLDGAHEFCQRDEQAACCDLYASETARF